MYPFIGENVHPVYYKRSNVLFCALSLLNSFIYIYVCKYKKRGRE